MLRIRLDLTATPPMWPPTDMTPVWAQQPGCRVGRGFSRAIHSETV